MNTASQLNRRCALFTWVAMTLAIGTGLLAWGPILLQPGTHGYADARTLRGVANALNVVLSLPMLAAGVWGWRALGRSSGPLTLQTPWRWCFGIVVLAATLAATDHLAPDALGYVAAQSAGAGVSALLLCACLAERVDARFGSHGACIAALGVALAASIGSLGAAPDIRPLLLLQWMPLLLIPAGALNLPGQHTTRGDWLLILGLYALAHGSDLGDETVLRLSAGAVSGQALMHLCLAGVAAWLAYRASRAAAADDEGAGLAQANTSLSTSG